EGAAGLLRRRAAEGDPGGAQEALDRAALAGGPLRAGGALLRAGGERGPAALPPGHGHPAPRADLGRQRADAARPRGVLARPGRGRRLSPAPPVGPTGPPAITIPAGGTRWALSRSWSPMSPATSGRGACGTR